MDIGHQSPRSAILSHDKLPSGKRLHSYWKLSFTVDLPSYKMVIFHSYVSLPEVIMD